MTAIFTESEYEIELSAVQGPAGPQGYATPIANNTVVANVSGSTAAPTATNAASMRTLLAYDDYMPIINMDDYGVHPGNSAATNQTAIANLIARIKNSSQINRFHLRLNRAGTFNIQKGTSGDYALRRSAILLPSNCTLELNKDSVLRMPLEQLAYLIRNDDPINGNRNISIIGGQWDGNATTGDGILEEGAGVGQQGYYGMILWLENIENLRVEGVVCRNPNMWAICGTKLRRAVFQSVQMDNVHRDGIHLSGACEDVGIFDYRGQTGDNSLVIATSASAGQDDSAYFFGNHNWANGEFIHGDMKRITIQRAEIINSNGPIAIFGRRDDVIEDIHISDITGTTSSVSAYGFAINKYPLQADPGDLDGLAASTNPTVKRLTIERFYLRVKPTEVSISLSGDQTRDVTIKDVVSPGMAVLAVGTGYENLKMDNIRATGTEHAIQLGNDPSSIPFFSKNIHIGNQIYTPSGGARAAISINSNANWDNFYVDNLACAADGVEWKGIVAAGTSRKKIIASTLAFGPGGERCISGPIDLVYDNLTYGSSTLAWLAVDGARISGNKLNYNGLGASQVGFTSSVANAKRVVAFTVNHTDIAHAGTIRTYAMPKLPRGAIITGAAIKANVQYGGGGVTFLLLRVRWWDAVAAAWVNIVDDVNVGAAVDASRLAWNTASNLAHSMNSTVDWELLVQSGGANIDQCTQGQAVVFLEYFVACTSQQ